jgi:hypothetical protein
VLDRHRARLVIDGPAHGELAKAVIGLVANERRAADADVGPEIRDTAARAVASAAAGAKVGRERVGDDGRRPLIQDAAAVAGPGAAANGLITCEAALADGQGGAGLVVDAAALVRQAMNDGQVGDRHVHSASDVEHAAHDVAADGELASPRPRDGLAFADHQLPQRQGDRLPVQLVAELDRVAGAGRADERTQGSGRPVIGGAGDDQRAGDRAKFKSLHARTEAPPSGSTAAESPAEELLTFLATRAFLAQAMEEGANKKEKQYGGVSIGRSVCETMHRPSLPARRPSAGAV